MQIANRNSFLIALGANRGESAAENAAVMQAALGMIETQIGPATPSRFYRSPAFPAGSGPDFVNACAVVRAALSPERMLAALHRIETALGRVRAGRWAARTIDLDLLAAGAAVLPDQATFEHWRHLAPADQCRLAPAQLILPHPRLQDRAFVLVPLADIAPGWVHPVLHRNIEALLAAVDPAETAQIRPI